MHKNIIINPTTTAVMMPIVDLGIVLGAAVELLKAIFGSFKIAEAVLGIVLALALLLEKVDLRGADVVAGTTIML